MSRSPDDDPDDLSLAPGKGKRGGPDFSKVSGGVDSTADRADAGGRPDFGGVQGSSGSTAAAAGGRSYTVEKGDSLSAISKKVYGDANRWREIFEANRDQLDDPDLIHPGQTLRMP